MTGLDRVTAALGRHPIDGAQPMPGTERATDPVISPEGRRIAFKTTGGRIFVVPIAGGSPRQIAENAIPADLRWVDGDQIGMVYGNGQEVRRLDSEQGGGTVSRTASQVRCLLQEPVGDRLLCGGAWPSGITPDSG